MKFTKAARSYLIISCVVAAFGNDTFVADHYRFFETPTRMVAVVSGADLAMYCAGKGSPVVVLESGAGGASYEEWYKLQPLLAKITRVCSYDRAGFGFSRLGNDMPRDLVRAIEDLRDLLDKTERGPYLMVGHSLGGMLLSAYTDPHPGKVAAMVLLEPAFVLSANESSSDSTADREQRESLEKELQQMAECEGKADQRLLRPAPGDACVDTRQFDSLPRRMARLEIQHESRPEYWRALKSEMESNWSEIDRREAVRFLPHHWDSLPLRVITAAVTKVSDRELARAIGVPSTDRQSLVAARENHRRWERRQAEICTLSADCSIIQIVTANHSVQNADPEKVARVIADLIAQLRAKWRRDRRHFRKCALFIRFSGHFERYTDVSPSDPIANRIWI